MRFLHAGKPSVVLPDSEAHKISLETDNRHIDARWEISAGPSVSQVGSRCSAKGKVQVGRQVKLLPAPQLLPESVGLNTR